MSRTYRDLAQKALERAGQQMREMPTGDVRPDVITAHAALVQATATIALTQALLYVGDTISQADHTIEK
ncbi:hypothetical protein [Actinacidiphila acididurans]|uniref:Uncharacterized protein n=1 Tax=Actinacidiphila acididurans TaxID=2784346 RepID=A0ABS2U768_9ACTN|nr:hypothetical protein [Actinacidiphila acididurans]MBM9510008.1 hypothetical protein [Actinacidiphila acididurans]